MTSERSEAAQSSPSLWEVGRALSGRISSAHTVPDLLGRGAECLQPKATATDQSATDAAEVFSQLLLSVSRFHAEEVKG